MAEMTNPVAPLPTPARTPTPLRRLSGTAPTVRWRDGLRATLWLGDTQLVQELVRVYTLEIQRFALADLHAVQFRRTARGLIWNGVLLLLLVPLGLMLPTVLEDGGWFLLRGHLVFWGALVLCVTLLAVNLVRGPTCRATVVTALGPQELPSLSRVRTARRALQLIAVNVAAVQGALPPDEAAQAVDRARTQAAPGPAPATAFQAYHY